MFTVAFHRKHTQHFKNAQNIDLNSMTTFYLQEIILLYFCIYTCHAASEIFMADMKLDRTNSPKFPLESLKVSGFRTFCTLAELFGSEEPSGYGLGWMGADML